MDKILDKIFDIMFYGITLLFIIIAAIQATTRLINGHNGLVDIGFFIIGAIITATYLFYMKSYSKQDG